MGDHKMSQKVHASSAVSAKNKISSSETPTFLSPSEFDQNHDYPNHTVIALLRPLALVCRIFGVLPIKIISHKSPGSKNVTCSLEKGWVSYTVVILCLSSIYMGFQMVSLGISVSRSHSFIRLIAQSLWVNAGLISYVLSIFMLCSGSRVIRLFRKWCKIESELSKMFCPRRTQGHIKGFQAIYLGLAVSSILFCLYHALRHPDSPVYPFAYLDELGGTQEDLLLSEGNEWMIWLYATGQSIFIGWKWAGTLVLEGICCLFATVILQCMASLIRGLQTTFLVLKVTLLP
jgi:hypothetical protein